MAAITTDKAPPAVGPYSQGIVAGGLLFVSGQLPIDPKTGELPEDMLQQMRQCLANVEAIAIAAGTSLAKTVKTTVLVTDLSRFSEFNEIYGRAFAAPYPARACYEVSALPRGAKVEIEAVIALS
ncbi:RidA family protein [Rhizobium sp. WYJ-E13]|jgi:2-iminobutanoate/2-iminopropanoate deaminase|uniref:RidA family protein n=1 Tax=Rhizobium sp. WYJ-E13 TaxID=2849093 RepID=UPI001C1EF462|nr:RidA family protein [Rhizobium sp. WYJ-E13]QWW72395.1 RidA family protein [Rhizobium sp. WYJ-E13]